MRGRPVAPAIHSSVTGVPLPRTRRDAADSESRSHRGPQADEVIVERVNPVSADRRLHDPNSQRREARRPAGGAGDQVRARNQPQDREVARRQNFGHSAIDRGRGENEAARVHHPCQRRGSRVGAPARPTRPVMLAARSRDRSFIASGKSRLGPRRSQLI